MSKFSKKGDLELLREYGSIIEELIQRKVLRTRNNPIADYGEYIVAKKFNLELARNSNSGFDARDSKSGLRYQIKVRRKVSGRRSGQLGVIRNLDSESFDFLIAVIFNSDFSVAESYKINKEAIKRNSRFSIHQNGHILNLRGPLLNDEGVERIDLR